MPSEFRKPAYPTQELTRAERFNLIFDLMTKAPRAHTAEGALEIVSNAFNQVEQRQPLRSNQKMKVDPFRQSISLPYKGHVVYCQMYDSHLLFLGENGAINIFRKNSDTRLSLLENNLDDTIKSLRVEFSKSGADGKDMWGN
jgi:hypothetical protein